MLAWLSLTASLKASTALAVVVPPLVLGVPALDTLLVMRDRFMLRPDRGLWARVRRVFQADRQHVHHLILAVAEHRLVVLSLFALVGGFCFLSLLAVFRNDSHLAAATLAVEAAVVVLMRNVRMRRMIGTFTKRGFAGAIPPDIARPLKR